MVPDDEVQYVEVKAIGVQEVSCKEVRRCRGQKGLKEMQEVDGVESEMKCWRGNLLSFLHYQGVNSGTAG